MVKQTVPDLKELFRQAAEVAQQVPESMQEAAFNRALDLLVSGPTPSPNTSGRPKTPTRGRADSTSSRSLPRDLLQQIDSTRHPGVRSATKVLDRALMILQIALRDHDTDGLTSVEIARILTDKFRLGTSRQAVGMALKDASNLVDRVGEGQGYRYRIMGPGEEYLAHLDESADAVSQAAPSAKRGASRRRRTDPTARDKHPTTNSAEAVSRKNAGKKMRANRSASTGLGPKAAIVSLVQNGFFASSKTGPDVQGHLKTKRGFDLGTDQLRLVECIRRSGTADAA